MVGFWGDQRVGFWVDQRVDWIGPLLCFGSLGVLVRSSRLQRSARNESVLNSSELSNGRVGGYRVRVIDRVGGWGLTSEYSIGDANVFQEFSRLASPLIRVFVVLEKGFDCN